MRNERKYKVLSLLTAFLLVLLGGVGVREYFRMGAAEARQFDEYVLKGARTYAMNCVQCHGPRGEGVIGMPLNLKEHQIDYQSPAGKEIYNELYEAILQGRPGNDAHFQWERTDDGKWISYTAMPAWGKEYGGSLDEDYIKALTLFIMKPGGDQWNLVGDTQLAPYQEVDLQADESGQIPLPDSADTEVNAAAQALLRDIPRSQCLTCHIIGAKGAYIGPDLSQVGSWGVDREFLENWIQYSSPDPSDDERPGAMAHEERMPVYWSANRATVTPELNLENPVLSEGPYYMPRFKDKLTDEEITILSRYLLGLK